MPSPIPIPILSILFLDLLASAEIREETQLQSVTGTSQAPGPRDNDMDTSESGRNRCHSVIENVHVEMRTTNSMTVLFDSEDFMSSVMFSAGSELERSTVESPWSHRVASESAPATSNTPLPTVPNARPIEGMRSARSSLYGHVPTGLITNTATTTMRDAPLALHNAVDHLIAKHPKVLSTVSTVLTIAGGIILFPGVSASVRGTILAHPAVTIAGGIAVAVGRRLRRALNSAAALAAAQAQAQAQASGQVATEDVDEHRDGTVPEGLLSVDFVV